MLGKNESEAVFIIGVGRSGTTMVYDMLAVSNRYRWLSRLEADVRPSRLLSKAARHDHKRRMHAGEKRSRWFAPSEAYKWWDRALPRFTGVSSPVLSIADLKDSEIQNVEASIHKLIQGDAVFLNKNTRNSRRIDMLAQLPGVRSRFVHVVRHPLAVALSMARVAWWPAMPIWFRDGATPDSLAGDFEGHLALAAELWVREIQVIHATLPENSDSVLTVRYEDVAADPVGWGERTGDFAGADSPEKVGAIAAQFVRSQGRHRWSEELSEATIDRLWSIVGDEAERYGYERGG